MQYMPTHLRKKTVTFLSLGGGTGGTCLSGFYTFIGSKLIILVIAKELLRTENKQAQI
jgi:hypothetical protein